MFTCTLCFHLVPSIWGVWSQLCAPATCAQIAAKVPEVGCAWNSIPDGGAPRGLLGVGLLWWMRYRTVLR
jgi:hypothetical protein